MFHISLCLFVYVNLFLYAKCSIPVEKLCVNSACKEPISKAQGSVKYSPPMRGILGFDPGQDILITSKSKNANDYWGAVIEGKSGYVPSNLIKEVKVYYNIDKLVAVPVELPQQNLSTGVANSVENNTQNQIPPKTDKPEESSLPQLSESTVGIENNLENLNTIEKPINPDETFKIIEGTTIYADEGDEITPSATVNVKSTPQTVAPVSGRSNKEDKQETATVQQEKIELNDSYKKDSGSRNNFTVETVKENEQSTKTESKEIYAEEDEEDDDEEGGGDDEEEEDEEENDDSGDEVTDNSITKSHPIEKKEIEIVKDGEGKNSKANEGERMIASNSQSVHAGVESSPPESVVNVVESSVTSQVTASVDNAKTELQIVQEPPVTLPPPLPQNLDNKMETRAQGVPNSRSSLKGYEENLPPPKGGLNVPSQRPGGGFDIKYAVPQAVMLGPDSQAPPQIISQAPAATPESGSGTLAAKVDQQMRVDASAAAAVPQTDVGIGSETVATEAEPVVVDASVRTPTPESVNEAFDVTTPKIKTEAFATISQPAASDSSTIFSEFSVSADTLKEDPRSMKKPNLIPEMIQERVGVTTPQPIVTETPEQHPAPSPPPKVPDTVVSPLPENVEVTTEAPVTPSALPETITEKSSPKDSKVAEDLKTSEQPLEESNSSLENPEQPGVMSHIRGMFSSWFSPSTKEEVPHEPALPSEPQNSERFNEALPGTCQAQDFGSDCKDFGFAEVQTSSWGSWIPSGMGLDGALTQSNTFLYLVVTAVTVLLFTLGHNLIEKRGKTGPLIAKINKLEQELLVTTKECFLLKDEIQSAREKITLYENSANDKLVLSLQAELDESKKIRVDLESSIEILQQELDAATEAGLDLNKMLSEVLTQKGGSESLLKSVESLQAQLDSQQKVIDEMTKKLGVKNEENEALQSALDSANEKSDSLEEELTDMKHNLNLHLKEKEDLTRDLNSQISHLKTRINQLGEAKEREISKLKKELGETQAKLEETSSALTVKEEEVKALKGSMKLLKTKGDLQVETVFDVSRVQAELAKEAKENRALLEKLQKEESSKKALAEQVKALDEEMKKLKMGYEEAEQRKDEAEKKLEVLSTYFKEKETQLQKELGLQEALWAQKKGDEKAVYNMMKSLQEEVESYKSQNETLKQEILDQERGLKSQMATFEQKAYENWVAARQAERKLEETKQEMAQLRNRLTFMEKNSNNVDGKGNIRSSEELNGVEAASPILHDTSSPLLFPPLPLDPNNSALLPPGFIPPHMFMPPPPMGGFIPPPPFLPGDRRPPPLGRMSSPPLNNRFSPSSPPDYPFERMPSPPLSPNYRFKD